MSNDTLIALIERGPLFDGDVPSKVERDELLESGLAVRVVVSGEDGFTAATYSGRDAYTKMYSGSTVAEAIKNRKSEITATNSKIWERVSRAEYTGSCSALAKNIKLTQLSDDPSIEVMGD